MSKKFIFIVPLFIIALFLTSIVKGQATVPANFTFCDDSYDPLKREFTVFAQAGEEKEICGIFSAIGESPVEITYGLSMGTFDQNGVQVCDQDMGPDNKFSKLFRNQERIINLNPGESKEIKEKIQIPFGMSGMIYGCVTYKGKQTEKKEGRLFDIVMRKAVKLNVFVGGEADIKSSISLMPIKGKIFSSNKKIKADLDNNGRLNIGFLVKNEGNVDQNVSIKGSIYNSLGFEKQFEIPTQKIGGGSEFEFSTNVGIIPSYKGFFNIDLELNGEPFFSFDSSNIDEEFKKPTTVQDSGKLFIFSRIWIIALALAILVIYLILKPIFRRNKQ